MSVASTVMVLSPLVRGTSQEKVGAERVAGLPLQRTLIVAVLKADPYVEVT